MEGPTTGPFHTAAETRPRPTVTPSTWRQRQTRITGGHFGAFWNGKERKRESINLREDDPSGTLQKWDSILKNSLMRGRMGGVGIGNENEFPTRIKISVYKSTIPINSFYISSNQFEGGRMVRHTWTLMQFHLDKLSNILCNKREETYGKWSWWSVDLWNDRDLDFGPRTCTGHTGRKWRRHSCPHKYSNCYTKCNSKLYSWSRKYGQHNFAHRRAVPFLYHFLHRKKLRIWKN
jgi:hypothetical protein